MGMFLVSPKSLAPLIWQHDIFRGSMESIMAGQQTKQTADAAKMLPIQPEHIVIYLSREDLFLFLPRHTVHTATATKKKKPVLIIPAQKLKFEIRTS